MGACRGVYGHLEALLGVDGREVAQGRKEAHLVPFPLSLVLLGDVAKWQGRGLQNPDRGFKSRRRLHKAVIPMAAFVFRP